MNSRDLPSLTGLRWVAAFVVFGFHLHVIEYFAPGNAANLLETLFGSGSVGVSFFFVLSGFVLMWASRRTGCRRFWWRRFARVYPLHAATALLVLVFVLVHTPHAMPTGGTTAANLALVQSWFPDVAHFQSLNTVSWTLSCEAFFYLLFPLLAAGVARLRARGLAVTAAGAWAASVLGPATAGLVASAEEVRWFFHWTPLGRLPEFVCGVALARLVRFIRPPRRRPMAVLWAAAAVLTLAGYLLAGHIPEPYGHAACTMPGFALILVAAALSDVQDRWTPWRNRAMVRLGELSFAFYLVHLIVVRVLEAIIGYHPRLDGPRAAALTLTAFLLSLGASWLLHTGVERPVRVLLLRRPERAIRPAERAEPARAGGTC